MGEAGKGVASDKGRDGEIRDGEPDRQSQPFNTAAKVEKVLVAVWLLMLKVVES